MIQLRPFRAIRPIPKLASRVAALPYDVMNRKEAEKMAEGNPYSFLHVDKAEIDLPEIEDIYDARVYERAKKNLDSLLRDGVLIQDTTPSYAIYRLTMNDRTQTGIVCCPSVDDYMEGRIKKHELTRADKEADRIRHVDTLDANTGPIFLMHRPNDELDALVNAYISTIQPIYDFIGPENVKHEAWLVDDAETIEKITQIFSGMDALYIADGHHRCASAVRVAQLRREENPSYDGSEEFNYFLSVVFPSNQLQILDYNRVVKDLCDRNVEDFMVCISENFILEKDPANIAPSRPHTFGMLLGESRFLLTAKEGTWDDTDPVASLDVSILYDNLLKPILGIGDPRTDKRIDFVGGIRGIDALAHRVKTDMQVAFAMYPTSLDELMDVADAGKIMPPKSTWFEPKLLSGLFIHALK
ncbi:MAG: DUF1015 family protein [Clostridiales Family XIII bacterium]|nr:DUF1015 family protein [Clostridiales Family XIII bacterium]